MEIERQASGAKYILTTSKDAVRIEILEFNHAKWFYLPLHLDLRDSKKIFSKLKL
jgi:tetraacyldisaccharide-1-P 4'-kinase